MDRNRKRRKLHSISSKTPWCHHSRNVWWSHFRYSIQEKDIAKSAIFSLAWKWIITTRPGFVFKKDKSRNATIKPDGRLRTGDGFEGSIHKAGSHYMNGSPCNGWDHWFLDEAGRMVCLDVFRQRYRTENGLANGWFHLVWCPNTKRTFSLKNSPFTEISYRLYSKIKKILFVI